MDPTQPLTLLPQRFHLHLPTLPHPPPMPTHRRPMTTPRHRTLQHLPMSCPQTRIPLQHLGHPLLRLLLQPLSGIPVHSAEPRRNANSAALSITPTVVLLELHQPAEAAEAKEPAFLKPPGHSTPGQLPSNLLRLPRLPHVTKPGLLSSSRYRSRDDRRRPPQFGYGFPHRTPSHRPTGGSPSMVARQSSDSSA